VPSVADWGGCMSTSCKLQVQLIRCCGQWMAA